MSFEHPSFGKLDDDRIIIFDTTLRDGEQSPGFSMNLHEKIRMAEALTELVHARQPDVVDSAGWRAIDAAEITRGGHGGRPRNKFTDVAEMLAAAATGQPAPPLRRRLLARLRDF